MGTKTFDPLFVLGLYTETAMHCGAESETGHVDLPVQRERHTGYPVIPGSTIKGVFRDEMRRKLNDDAKVNKLFGSEDANSPGSVGFSDGILVAFPVRSSEFPFHWVTCPFVLERALRKLGVQTGGVPAVEPGKAKAKGGEGQKVLLEEVPVQKEQGGAFFADGGAISRIEALIPGDEKFEYTHSIFQDRLLVLSDSDFDELITTATEVRTRNKLNVLGTTTTIPREQRDDLKEELGRNDISDWELQGNMFVEELVPPETLFLCQLRAAGSDALKGVDPPSLVRLGAGESVGFGLTHVTRVDFDGREG